MKDDRLPLALQPLVGADYWLLFLCFDMTQRCLRICLHLPPKLKVTSLAKPGNMRREPATRKAALAMPLPSAKPICRKSVTCHIYPTTAISLKTERHLPVTLTHGAIS